MDFAGPTPEPSWQEELDRIAPRNGTLSWLRLVWVAGDPWEPVGRWVVYQMMPLWRAPEMARLDLVGENPRLRGRHNPITGEYESDPACTIDRLQWVLFRETGCYGRPYWVVQGTRGGHKRRFTRAESVISRMNGGPGEPPAPGDLPYAAPDGRTWDKLSALDLVRLYTRTVDFALRTPEALDSEDRAITEAMKQKVWGWLESQVQDAWRDAPLSARNEFAGSLPRGSGAFETQHH